MSNAQTEELRRSAHSVAEVLYEGEIGGACYHGERHKCFTVQGRKPLALYKVEEMCERCAAAWHATMAATLLDALVIGQRFLNGAMGENRSEDRKAVAHALRTGGPISDAVVQSLRTGGFVVKPRIRGSYGHYTNEEKIKLLADYATIKKRPAKGAFLTKYGLKPWHLSGWRKSPTHKTASRKMKRTGVYPCKKCGKVFFHKNGKTLHERACKDSKS